MKKNARTKQKRKEGEEKRTQKQQHKNQHQHIEKPTAISCCHMKMEVTQLPPRLPPQPLRLPLSMALGEPLVLVFYFLLLLLFPFAKDESQICEEYGKKRATKVPWKTNSH